jgi:hypothetical protein
MAHHMTVLGNPTKSGSTCDQDAFILGGTTTATNNTGPTDAFQGYGSVIAECHFNRVRRAVYLRTYANSVVVRDNNLGSECGGDCAFEIDATAGFVRGCEFSGNLLEMPGYLYGFVVSGAANNNTFAANSFWDGNAGANRQLYCYYFNSGANGNTVIGPVQNDAGTSRFLYDANTSVPNHVIDGTLYGAMYFQNAVTITGATTMSGAANVDGLLSLRDGMSAAPVISGTLARLGYGSGVPYWSIQNSGSPVDSRLLRGYNSSGTPVIELDTKSGFVRIAGGPTGSRPWTGFGDGTQWFDTTLEKPIWLCGSVWRDASGNAV